MLKKLLPLAFLLVAFGCSGGGDDAFDSPFAGRYVGTAEVLNDDSNERGEVVLVIDEDGSIFGTARDSDGEATIRGEVDDDGDYDITFEGDGVRLRDRGFFDFEANDRLVGEGTILVGGETFETRYELDRVD